MRIGAVITRERLARNLSLSELARRAGLAPAVLSRIESGQRKKPSLGSLEAIERALELGPGDLQRLAGPAPDATGQLDALRALGIPEHNIAEFREYAPYMSQEDWEDVIATARRRAEKQARQQQPPDQVPNGQGKSLPNHSPQAQAAQRAAC